MSKRYLALALAATVALAGALVAGQQNQIQQEEPDVKVEVNGQEEEGQQLRQRQNLEETTLRQSRPLIHRASALIGLEVQNSAGKDLGQIDDLAIDGNTGKIEYAAVSFGGFVGIGDKLFAVPWDAVQIRQVGDRQDDEWVAVINVNQQTLENAQGFDQDNWPDMADEQWRTENDRVFRTTQRELETTTPPRR